MRLLIPLLLLSVILSGCSPVENNYLRPEDFAGTLERQGIKPERVRPLPPEPFRATSGVAVMVAGSEIGVYKFDQNSRLQVERVANLKKTGRTYINGIPYPIKVHGSFMFMGLEKNPKKHDIIRAIGNFK